MSDSTSTPAAGVRGESSGRFGFVRTAGVIAGLVLVALLATVIVTLVVAAVLGVDTGSTLVFVATTVGTELCFLLTGGVYLRFRSSFHLPVRIPTRQARPYLVGGLLACFGTVLLSFASTDAILPTLDVVPGYVEYSGFGRLSGTALVAGAVLSVAVVAPVEEFFFRGVIQGRLRERLGPGVAVGIAGAVFALFHVYPVALLSPPVLALVHMATYYTVMGVVFGWVYQRTDTLIAPIAVHGAFNVVLFAVLPSI